VRLLLIVQMRLGLWLARTALERLHPARLLAGPAAPGFFIRDVGRHGISEDIA